MSGGSGAGRNISSIACCLLTQSRSLNLQWKAFDSCHSYPVCTMSKDEMHGLAGRQSTRCHQSLSMSGPLEEASLDVGSMLVRMRLSTRVLIRLGVELYVLTPRGLRF